MKRIFCIAWLAGSTCHLAHAGNWQAVVGASALEQLVSGASAEIEVKPGVIAVGHYHADGSAEIEAWGESFLRTWKVSGEDQVCYTSELETNCFNFERNPDQPSQYRARNVDGGDTVAFSIQEGQVLICT